MNNKIDLVYKKYFEIKTENCLGCQFDYPSQRDHACCMDDSAIDSFYFIQSVEYYKNEGLLSSSEADQILDNFLYKSLDL